jgi:hypothetical protein
MDRVLAKEFIDEQISIDHRDMLPGRCGVHMRR